MTLPIVEIIHREEFAAAHQLRSGSLSEKENQETYGPCYRLHGHNYILEVTVRGPVNPQTGMVINLDTLRSIMLTEIIEQVDHRSLDEDVPFLKDLPVSTAENLAIAFWNRIATHEHSWGQARLRRVRVMESEANFVDYFGPEAL